MKDQDQKEETKSKNEKWKTETIYHYCSCEAFVSIFSERTLRVTNIKKSNDYTEIVNALDLFQNSLRIACFRFRERHPMDLEFDRMYQEIDITSLVEGALINDTLNYYVVCFSESSDSLSQWRGYANDATGVAIGFDKQYLQQATDLRSMKFMRVEYDKLKVREDLVNYIIEKFEEAKEDKGDFITSTNYANVVDAIIGSFVYNAVFYKSSAFSEEKEWRLVFYPFGKIRNLMVEHEAKDMPIHHLYYDRMLEYLHEELTYGPFIMKPLSFGLRRSNIFSYFNLDFTSIVPFFVREIVLGPKNSMDDLDLRLFLLSKGFDTANIDVIRSKATYQ